MNLCDNDMYKFYVSQQIWRHYRFSIAEFRTQIRSGTPALIKPETWTFDHLKGGQLAFLNAYLDTDYLEALMRWRYDPSWITPVGFKGPWWAVTLLEIPILAAMAARPEPPCLNPPPSGIFFSEIGTRRRCAYAYQYRLLTALRRSPYFRGTSNVQMAMDLGLIAVGSMPHEWVMGVGALDSIQHANRIAAEKWNCASDCFLPDTYGVDAFLADDVDLRQYRAIRHDSGSVVDFYRKVRSKYPRHTISLSNSVTYGQAEAIAKASENVDFGFGGILTNPEPGRLEAVIKLWEVDGMNTVKLSDTTGKEFGEPEMVRAVKRIYGYGLDAASTPNGS